jgi:putative membrane protein (TIGR04086 family)
VPELAAPLSTLDNIDAIVASFVMMYLATLWLGKRVDSDFVLHGALVGLTALVLFTLLWTFGTGSPDQPLPYIAAHCMKVLGGIAGGYVVKQRRERLRPARTG